jgi:hypothetical protein
LIESHFQFSANTCNDCENVSTTRQTGKLCVAFIVVSSYVVRHVENDFQRSLLTQQQQQQQQKQDLIAKYLLSLTLFLIELS